MPATKDSILRTAMMAVTCVCVAGSAPAGGFDYHIKFVPDFDQKRGPGTGIPGLPNDGACHCMPTSCINWVGLLANRGYPQLAPPGNWQLAGRYNMITAALDDLGEDMSVSPGGPDPKNPGENLPCGTGGDEAEAALIHDFDALTPGKFIVAQHYASGNYCPLYTNLVASMLTGSLVILRYGYYDEVFIPAQGAPAYVRDGGHIMSLTGVQNLFEPDVKIRFRNPSSDEDPENLNSQSIFATDDSGVQNITTMFANSKESVVRTQTRLTFGTSIKFLDGYIQIKPKFGLHVPDCCNHLQMNGMNPIPAIHGNPPMNASYTSPSGTAILDVEIHPELNRHFMITAGPGALPPRLWAIDPLGSPPAMIMNLVSPTSMTFGRKGELYILEGAMLRVINPDLASPQIGTVSIAGAPIAGRISYDDRADEVLGISPTSHELVRIKWSPAGPTIVREALPAGLTLTGSPLVVASRQFDARYYITSATHSLVYVVEPNATGALTVVDQIILDPVLAGATIANDAMHVDTREHVLLARQVGIVELEKVGGLWQPAAQSDFAGLAVGRHMRIAESRSNFDPATMSGPEQLDVLPTEPVTEEADCHADIAPSPLGDGVVNIQDLLRVIATWGPCAGTPENCDGDIAPENVGNQQVNIQDLLLVIRRWGPCP